MTVILQHLLVLLHLAVEAVHQHVDRGVEIVRGTGDVNDLPGNAQVDLGLLALLFFGEVVYAEDDVGAIT